jgi:hypothetical protein
MLKLRAMGTLFPDDPEYPDYRQMPTVAVRFHGLVVEVVPAILIVVGVVSGLCPIHEPQPEPPHRDMVHVDQAEPGVVEALPPPAPPPMPFQTFDSNDVVRRNWTARARAHQHMVASSMQMSGGVLWFASTQADAARLKRPPTGRFF